MSGGGGGAPRRFGRFRNAHGLSPWRARDEVRRLAPFRDRTPWPAAEPAPPVFPPPPADVPPGQVAVTFIGHATVLLRLPGDLGLLTDPIFSDQPGPAFWARRARPPGVALAALPPPLDVVLVSHNHYDHMDLPSLRALHARFAPAPLLLTGLGNRRTLVRGGVPGARELDWWQSAPLPRGGGRVTFVPARHYSARGALDGNRSLWGGFVIEPARGGGRIYFAGDTGDGPHFAEIAARLGPPDLALLPIGAYAPPGPLAAAHLDPEEAVRAHRTLGARVSVAVHFGTFRLTQEGMEAPVARLAEARRAAGVAEDAFRVLGLGETALLPFSPDPGDEACPGARPGV